MMAENGLFGPWIMLLGQTQGGMMEEWHQKLHNNTSPDDVVICQALIAYIDAGLDISAYWATLKVRRHPLQARLCSFRRSSSAIYQAMWEHGSELFTAGV